MRWRTKALMVLALAGVAAGTGFAQSTDLPAVYGFEGTLPSYWAKGNEPSGSTVSWATDQSRSMGHSLKITKSATSDSASWSSENMCDLWMPKHGKNLDILAGAYVRTQGVNTSPATDDQKWWISYSFYDSAGVKMGEVKLPIPQATASTGGWVADTNGIGTATFPRDSWKTIIKFVGGKNATGTVWADDFVFAGRTNVWDVQDWNTQVGVPTGWYYWLPPNGGNDGVLNDGFENTKVTTEAAHTGLSSLKFDMPFNRTPHDGFVGTRRYLLSGASAPSGSVAHSANAAPGDISTLQGVAEGDVVRISVWIKASNLVPDSAALYPETWSVGFTPIWSKGYLNNDAYDEIGGKDNMFVFPPVTQFDWTQYTLDVTVPTGQNVKALSVRLHIYSRFTGTIYFDDLQIRVVGTPTGITSKEDGPKVYELFSNYPNPFNPSTVIRYNIPHESNISLVVYNVLGQEVRSLFSGHANAGRFEAIWDGRDNVGQTVGTGVYFYRLNTGSVALVKKMLLLK